MGLTVPAMRPAAWEMTPSGKGMRIGVAGLTRTIERIQEQHRRRGVTHATFVAMQDAEDVAREATTCAVVCVSPRDFGRIEWAEVARVTTAAVRERGIPLAVVGDAPSHAAAWLHLLNVPHLALPEIESPDLVRRMRQLIVEPLQSALGQRVQRAALGNPTCEEDFLEALRALIEQEIRPPDEALDMLASRRPPYVRRVRDLPLQDKGSVGAIEKDARAARVPLSRLVTQVEGFHLRCHLVPGRPEEVAFSLGYREVASMERSVRRRWGYGLGALAKEPLGEQAGRVSDVLGHSHC